MAYLVVEQSFESPISDDYYDRAARRLDPCLEAYGARWRRSYIAADRRRIICEFEAADADAVRTAYRNAEVPFDRVWVAEVYAAEERADVTSP
jgi:hypothetical protein